MSAKRQEAEGGAGEAEGGGGGRRSVFSLRGAGLSVARVDPHVAGIQTSRIAPPLAPEEELADLVAPIKKLVDLANLITASLGRLMPHYTPWPMANETYLETVELAVAAAHTVVKSPDLREGEPEDVEERLREFGNAVISYAHLARMAGVTVAAQVGLTLPASVRSNAVNEERAGVSIMR